MTATGITAETADPARERMLAELTCYRIAPPPDASDDYLAGLLAQARADRADPEAAARKYVGHHADPELQAAAVALQAAHLAMDAAWWECRLLREASGRTDLDVIPVIVDRGGLLRIIIVSAPRGTPDSVMRRLALAQAGAAAEARR